MDQHCKKIRAYKSKGFKNVCGHDDTGTVDHIISLAEGGVDAPINYQMLCRSCNQKKGANILEEKVPVIPTIQLADVIYNKLIVDELRNYKYYKKILSSLFGTDSFSNKEFTLFSDNLVQWISDYFSAFGVSIRPVNIGLRKRYIPKSRTQYCNSVNPDFNVKYDVSRLYRRVL
jgi:hypothetical protein